MLASLPPVTIDNLPLVIASAIFSVTVVYWLTPVQGRKLVMLAASLSALFAFSPVYAALIVGLVGVTFLGSSFLQNRTEASRNLILILVLSFLISALIFVKLMNGANWRTPVLMAVGLSYIIFRLIHYAVLAHQQEIKCKDFSDFLDLLGHVLFFPSLLAGPVLYYESWLQQAPPSRMDFKNTNLSLLRILLGLFKKFVVSDQISMLIVLPVFAAPSEYPGWVIALTVCADFLRVYFDFSGYSDIAIGTAGLFGYKLPENFNFPIFKSNIAEFWRNWHITLHDFIRDHVFFPFFAYHPSPARVYAGLFLTMTLMMLWHAFSLGFLVMGVLHGIVFVLWHFLQQRKRQHPQLAAFFKTKPAKVFCVCLTFLFCSFSSVFGFRGVDATLALFSVMLGGD